MHHRHLVAFDIETTPDPDVGRRALGLDGDDAAVVRAMMARRLEETDGRTAYPAQPWHRVVSVGATIVDRATGICDVVSLGSSDLWDEAAHLRGFYDLVEGRRPDLLSVDEAGPRLLSWNGAGFDLPILRYRAMVHGIAAPTLNATNGSRRYDNYLNRYHDRHVDLMDVLASHGAAPRAGLDATARSLGLPVTEWLTHPIHEHVLAGDADLIHRYCRHDTVLTMAVGLTYLHHIGELSGDEAAALRERFTSTPRAPETELYTSHGAQGMVSD